MVGVLPHIVGVVEVRVVGVVRHPQGAVGQRAQVVVVVALLAVQVHAGGVAAALDDVAERRRAGGEVEVVVGGGAGVLGGNGLPVVVHRQIQRPPVQQRQGVERLLGGLADGDGLGEEVHAHVDASRLRAIVVPGEGAVGVQRALRAVAPHTQPQIGELDALGLQRLPIDAALVVGHVHAPAGGQVRPGVADALAVTDELVLLHGADGHAPPGACATPCPHHR